MQLRYYKEESGICKGEINIAVVASVDVIGRELSLKTSNRLWTLQADTADDALNWATIIKNMMRSAINSNESFAGDGADVFDDGDD